MSQFPRNPQADNSYRHPLDFAQEPRWYLPSWSERILLMRWRLLYFVPLILLLAFLAFLPWAILWLWKVVIICVALPTGAAVNAGRHAIRLRKEPFCIHCGYGLTGLPDGHICPECGTAFSLAEIDDYRRNPHWFIHRQKLRDKLPPPDHAFEAGPMSSPPSGDGT